MIPILLLIARSKLVPDFAITIHLIHLLTTSLYTRSLPTGVYWWAVQVCSAALMVSLGMWACQWRELQPMTFGGKGKARAAGGQNGHPTGPGAVEEGASTADGDGEGYVVGTGRGSRRAGGGDGAGAYEMVGMASRDGQG